jgi:hypothetical protein
MDPPTTEPPTTKTEPQPQDQTNNNETTLPLTPLPTFRIPGYSSTPLNLAGTPLSLLTLPLPASTTPSSPLPIPTTLATILYTWHPGALLTLLDLDAWFSFTWTLTLPSSVLEIGRVGTQLTFGTLDSSGAAWELMLSYSITPSTGTWAPLPRESMRGEANLTSVAEIDAAASALLRTWVNDKVWDAPKKGRHAFAVEYAPMDPFSDGIPMSPHWLYAPLDLDVCTTCGSREAEGAAEGKVAKKLNRCGRCGMAAYCHAECQRKDWAVHKALCGMGPVERGTAVRISMDGGLIAWDVERRFGEEGEEESESENPHFAEKVMKRTRVGGRLSSLGA